jgi:hypothetical protein
MRFPLHADKRANAAFVKNKPGKLAELATLEWRMERECGQSKTGAL